MSRPDEVEWTMRHALAGDSVAPWEDLRILAKEVIRLEKEISDKQALAQQAFDATHIDSKLFDAVVRILGGDPESINEKDYKIVDCWVDDYDSSIEVLMQGNAQPLTRETADKILALGFAQIYESQGDKGTHWTKTFVSSCRPKSGDGERSSMKAKINRLRKALGMFIQWSNPNKKDWVRLFEPGKEQLDFIREVLKENEQ